MRVEGRHSMLGADAFFDTFVAYRTVKYLREEREPDKSFLLWSGYIHPHASLIPMQRYWELYEPEKLRLPNRCANELRDGFEGHLIRARQRGWYDQTEEQVRRSLAGYYGCVSQMDACVGRVLDTLRELNLEDDSIVVYTSNHGEMAGAHHTWTKHVMYDEAVRVPLLLRVPGKRARPQASALVEQVDLFPTLAELAGLPAPEAIEGKSFARLLRDEAAPDRQRSEAYCEYCFHPKVFTKDNHYVGRPPLLMVRDKRWNLRYLDWDRCELYDLAEEPHERTNRIDDPQCRAKAEELKAIRFLRARSAAWRRGARGCVVGPGNRKLIARFGRAGSGSKVRLHHAAHDASCYASVAKINAPCEPTEFALLGAFCSCFYTFCP